MEDREDEDVFRVLCPVLPIPQGGSPERNAEVLGEAPADAAVSQAEITEVPALRTLLEGCDTVVHLAGPPSVAASFLEPAACVRAHAVGTAAICEALPRQVRRFVYVSSAEVYGLRNRSPVSEIAPCAPVSPYGAAKLAAEVLVGALGSRRSLEVVILRPFSVYGPGGRTDSALKTAVEQARNSEVVRLYAPDVVRDYCHVQDVVSAIVKAVSMELSVGTHVYNVGSGIGVSVGDVARLALALVGRSVPVEAAAGEDRPRSADVNELFADRRLIASELGWIPVVTLEAGLCGLLGISPGSDATSSRAAVRPDGDDRSTGRWSPPKS